MDQDFTKEDVIAACLITTQKDQSQEQLKHAERYLIAFQKAPQAWTLSSEILNTEDLQLPVYAQVAIFLKQKLQYDIAQLPQSEYLNITQVILKFLMKYYHPAVVSQLSLSLVLLYMHAFETLGDLIDILGQSLFTVDKKDVIALDIIKLLAEVVDDKRIIISKKQKDRYVTYLEEIMKPKVFALLDKIARADNLDKGVKFKILDVFQEWFFFSRKDESIIKNIASHSCFSLALISMNDDSLAEHARECLNFIIKAVKNPEQHPVIFEAIFKYILEYMNECNIALQKDIDHVLEYTKVFRAFGMKFSRIMITNPNENLIKFLEYLVELTANQKIIIDILVELEEFWKGFAEEFTSLLKKTQYSHKVEEFQKLIKTLILISLHRIKMTSGQLEFLESRNRRPVNNDNEEEDKIGAVDPDLRDLEEKQNERRLSKTILLHMQDILGFHATFTIISEALTEFLMKLQENNINWADPGLDVISNFECIFYGAKSSILAHPLEYRPDLTEFFKVVMPIKFDIVKFNRTKIELIDYTSDKAIVNDEIMSLMFNYLAENLLNPRLVQENGEALITLCQNWSSFVIRNFDSFLELRNKFEGNDELIIALAVAIAYDKQAALRERYLAQLCAPFAERILKAAELPDTETNEQILEEIRDNLRKLAMIFGNMPKQEDENGTHPLEPVFQELWPIFKALFKKYQDKPKLIVKLCNVMKKCMRALSLKFKPYLLEYFDVICEIFMRNPFPDLLYSIETSASVFGKVPDLIQPLTKVYEFISSATLNYVSDKNIKEHNQLIEDFFGMLFRYTKYIPSVILSSKTLDTNLYLADLIIGIDQPNVEKPLYLFLEYLFRLCSYNPQNEVEKAVTEIMVNKYGAIYMKKLLIELTKYPAEQLRSYILDVIFHSLLKLKRHTVEWVEAGLQEIPEAILTQSEKQDMLRYLNDIDTSTLKMKNKDEDESEKLRKISQKFMDIFDFFEERCKLYVMRDYRFERANTYSG